VRITLENRHASVCDPFQHVLMRQIRGETPPEQEKTLALLDEIFDASPDPVIESRNAMNLGGRSDEERLRLCLRYVHHVYGQKLGDQDAEALVAHARDLPGSAPAKYLVVG
jgi:hypothetical protein